jgi:hypothetical protein
MKIKKSVLFAIIIAFAGIPIGFAIARFWLPILAIIISFTLIALFVYCCSNNFKKYKLVSIIIWCIGALAGFLMGYRPYMTKGPSPWRWFPVRGWYETVMVEAHMEWVATAITWGFFLLLGAALWVAAIIKSKTPKIAEN